MFAGKHLDKKFNINDGACSVGRIVSVCDYMSSDEIQKQLQNTIVALDKVL